MVGLKSIDRVLEYSKYVQHIITNFNRRTFTDIEIIYFIFYIFLVCFVSNSVFPFVKLINCLRDLFYFIIFSSKVLIFIYLCNKIYSFIESLQKIISVSLLIILFYFILKAINLFLIIAGL